MKLLASYDNANHFSYLLNFFLAGYKTCSGMWKFRRCIKQNSYSKPTSCKKNKVCTYARSYVCMGASEIIFSLWDIIFRKAR